MAVLLLKFHQLSINSRKELSNGKVLIVELLHVKIQMPLGYSNNHSYNYDTVNRLYALNKRKVKKSCIILDLNPVYPLDTAVRIVERVKPVHYVWKVISSFAMFVLTTPL